MTITNGKRAKTMTDTTLQTTTTTLSVILMAALWFCLVPVLAMAMMARARAGMEHVRQMRKGPQEISVMMEKMRAHIATDCWFFGGGVLAVVNVAGCDVTTMVVLAEVEGCGW